MTYAWFDIGDGRQVYRRVPEPGGKRSDLPVPMIIGDHMDAAEHPCDGKTYESKSAFRRVTKQNGCIEVGNDPQRFKKYALPKPDRTTIKESILKAESKVKNGYRPA